MGKLGSVRHQAEMFVGGTDSMTWLNASLLGFCKHRPLPRNPGTLPAHKSTLPCLTRGTSGCFTSASEEAKKAFHSLRGEWRALLGANGNGGGTRNIEVNC